MKFNKNQILFFGLAAHFLAAFFGVGYHHPDELFQIFEFAGHKLGINSANELPWEFGTQMRSGIQPFIVYIITKAAHFVSIQNPFIISFIVRLLQALFSFFVTVKFLEVFEKEISSQKLKLWLWALGLLFWCLPYFHSRFSSENFSATLFLLGLVLFLKNEGAKAFLLSGFLFGLAFLCRFQIGFMIFGLVLWLIFIKKIKVRRLVFIFVGILLALVLGSIADKWLYGTWTLSWCNYLDLNLFQDKSSQFGREPFYYYIGEALLQLAPPFSLLIVFCIFAFWWKFKKHPITWITLPFVLLHFFVAHKELRFLFPLLNFLPFMLLYYFQSQESNHTKIFTFLRNKNFIRFTVVVNTVALLAFIFKPADNTSVALKKIYETVNGKNPVLLYENRDPYNNQASLNYFRNTAIKKIDITKDEISVAEALEATAEVYYFSDTFNAEEKITKQGKIFVKLYSNFPAWFSYFNFNGWLERSVTFSIYKME